MRPATAAARRCGSRCDRTTQAPACWSRWHVVLFGHHGMPGLPLPSEPTGGIDDTGGSDRGCPGWKTHRRTEVTVRGWVRTRRDSKAGLSFVQLHDGSSFAPSRWWPRHRPELRRRDPAPDRRLRRHRHGHARRVAGQGPVDRDAGRFGRGRRLGGRPRYATRSRPSATPSSTCVRCRTCACAPTPSARSTRVRNALAQAIHRYFHEHGFYWIHTPIVTAADAEGAGEMFRVSTLDLANLPRTPDGAIDFSQDFFGRPTFLTVSGQLNVETYCLAHDQRLHLRADVPGGELQHQPAPVGVLDGGAGDRLRRPLRRCRPGRGPAQVRLPRGAR